MRTGLVAGRISRRAGLGSGGVIGGRITLALAPSALSRLATGRSVVLVSGTNGKTTTSHLLAAAMRSLGPVAHNASGANMSDGALVALAADPHAALAVLEVDELHVTTVAAAVRPAVILLLNLSRDQLDRGSEVRAVAAELAGSLAAHPSAVVVANADDPMVVWAAEQAVQTIWVATGSRWSADARSCPRCGASLHRSSDPRDVQWSCQCGLTRPRPHWTATDTAAVTGDDETPFDLRLPGRFNRGNAVMAMAAASLLGVGHRNAAAAMTQLSDAASRYSHISHNDHELRVLLAKNPAGWSEIIGLLADPRPLLVIINAREADGRDTSWLWDVPFEQLGTRPLVVAGEHAADLGVRLTYAEIAHATVPDPLAGLALLSPGAVDVVANYTAFHQLHRRLAATGRRERRS